MSLVDVGSSLKSPCFRMAKVVIIPKKSRQLNGQRKKENG
jgi:hypothetical protein